MQSSPGFLGSASPRLGRKRARDVIVPSFRNNPSIKALGAYNTSLTPRRDSWIFPIHSRTIVEILLWSIEALFQGPLQLNHVFYRLLKPV